MRKPNVALVVGSSGIIGNALVRTLKSAPDWTVKAVRGSGGQGDGVVAVDLLDKEKSQEALKFASDTTHVFYAAYRPEADAREKSIVNTAMLENVLDGLKAAGAPVRRTVLYQGAKVYGGHLGLPVKTPYHEDAQRHLAENFYFAQADLLESHGRTTGADWSLLRPDNVIGDIVGNPMNIALVIGAYAALTKEVGLQFRFPGSIRTYGHLSQMTDSDWLAQVSIWAATAEAASREAFNVVGDTFRWEYMWKRIGDGLGLEVGDPQPVSLSQHMPLKSGLWRRLSTKAGLQDVPFEKLLNWGFGDFVLNLELDQISDMGKLRRAGFTVPVDTEAAILNAINSLRAQRYIA